MSCASPQRSLARMAHGKGAFWPVHDALFARDAPWTSADLQVLAQAHGIDLESLTRAADSKSYLAALRTETEQARRNGVTAPPVVLVNGRWFQGPLGFDRLRQMVREELGLSRSDPP